MAGSPSDPRRRPSTPCRQCQLKVWRCERRHPRCPRANLPAERPPGRRTRYRLWPAFGPFCSRLPGLHHLRTQLHHIFRQPDIKLSEPQQLVAIPFSISRETIIPFRSALKVFRYQLNHKSNAKSGVPTPDVLYLEESPHCAPWICLPVVYRRSNQHLQHLAPSASQLAPQKWQLGSSRLLKAGRRRGSWPSTRCFTVSTSEFSCWAGISRKQISGSQRSTP